mgnify:CR=1 FL=1
MKNSFTLRSVSIKQINAELRRRQRMVAKFKKRRAALVARLARLDAKIVRCGGAK